MNQIIGGRQGRTRQSPRRNGIDVPVRASLSHDEIQAIRRQQAGMQSDVHPF